MEQLSEKVALFLTKERPLIRLDLGETTVDIRESVSDTDYCYLGGKILNLNTESEEPTDNELDHYQELTKRIILAFMPLTKLTNICISVGRNDGVERIHHKYELTIYRSYLHDGKLSEDFLIKIIWLDESHVRVIPYFNEFSDLVNVDLNDEGYYEDSTSSFLGYQSREIIEAVEKHVEYKSKTMKRLLDLINEWNPSIVNYLKVIEYLNNNPEGTTPTSWQGSRVDLANIYLNQLINDRRSYHFRQLLDDAGIQEVPIVTGGSNISTDPLV